MAQLHVHPMQAGFAPRYEWHGKNRVSVYRHCGTDAKQGNKRFLGMDNVYYTVHICRCEVCGLSAVTADSVTLAKYDEACNS